MKLLIVEDQTKTGQYLRQGLGEAGFNADLVADGITGQQLALSCLLYTSDAADE